MQCVACSGAVEKALRSANGVSTVNVAFTTNRAVVIGKGLKPNVLAQLLTDAGYPAKLINEDINPTAIANQIEQQQIKHAAEWRRRAIVGLIIWIPAELLHWLANPLGIGGPWVKWLMLVASTIAMLFVGSGFIKSAYIAAKRKQTNMDTLISIGATTAYVFSLFIFIIKLLEYETNYEVYFTEAAALLAIISLGHWIEAKSTAKAGSAVRELLRMQPDQVEILNKDGTTKTIASEEVEEGEEILVKPGSRIPIDGIVIKGSSEVDESIVTGESLPNLKEIGATLIAGSMNTTGHLTLRSIVNGKNTTITRIAKMVAEAQSSKADIQRLADKVASIFVPIVLLIASFTFIIWLSLGQLETGIVSAVTVLIISCPCALGLATPMAIMVATGEASLRGILVKDAASLELAGKAKTCVFDKTGTLTKGKPLVSKIIAKDTHSNLDVLIYAGSVEASSEHPIAEAIVNEANKQNVKLKSVVDFKAIPGVGVQGKVNQQSVEVIRANSASCKVIVDGVEIGTIDVHDEIRPESKQTINLLQKMGIKVHLLSGDRKEVVQQVALAVGISETENHAQASPEDKKNFLKQLERPSIMVGDGINDATALAEADVGIAIASGTNIAMETASIVIPSNEIQTVAVTVSIAQKTLKAIKQNLVFAFMYNVAAIPIAALGLLGPHGPLIAAIAMGCSDITVIGNALRLKKSLRNFRKAKQ